ncbi:hypothetical protein [Alteromonas sp. S015]|uniref:hypothetical protein n=1 Tax=Alteromonas sp. S015 TaxID=3117401 RepID=UPI002FE1CA47
MGAAFTFVTLLLLIIGQQKQSRDAAEQARLNRQNLELMQTQIDSEGERLEAEIEARERDHIQALTTRSLDNLLVLEAKMLLKCDSFEMSVADTRLTSHLNLRLLSYKMEGRVKQSGSAEWVLKNAWYLAFQQYFLFASSKVMKKFEVYTLDYHIEFSIATLLHARRLYLINQTEFIHFIDRLNDVVDSIGRTHFSTHYGVWLTHISEVRVQGIGTTFDDWQGEDY